MLKRIAVIALTAALAVGFLTSCVGLSTTSTTTTTTTRVRSQPWSGISPGFVMPYHFRSKSPISLSPVQTVLEPPPLTQASLTRP